MHEMADPVPLSLGGHTIVGDRPGNEDAYMFKKDINEEGQKTDGVRRAFAAVFDGHGGSFVSAWMKENLLRAVVTTEEFKNDDYKGALIAGFMNCDAELQKTNAAECKTCGTCALACMIVNNTAHFVNSGDCRALLLGTEKDEQITEDHDPRNPAEKERLEKLGGTIVYKYKKTGCLCFKSEKEDKKQPARVMPGKLAVTRSIGDFGVKAKHDPILIIPDPEYYCIELGPTTFNSIVMASDGIWGEGGGAVKNNDASNLVKGAMAVWDPKEEKGTSRADAGAKTLVEKAYKDAGLRNVSCDNTTVVVIANKDVAK